MPTQITPNLYSVTRGANIFLLKTGENELALIDAGIPGARNLVLNAVSALGYQPSIVKHILITHADVDHVGSLHGLAVTTGARIYASAASVPYIESATSPPHVPPPMSWFGRGLQMVAQKKVQVDQTVQDGDLLDIGGGIRVIAAPGHTEDNVCYFWEREKVLFAADLLARFSTLRLTPPIITWNTEKARTSARRVLELQPEIIGFGHGATWRRDETPEELTALEATL